MEGRYTLIITGDLYDALMCEAEREDATPSTVAKRIMAIEMRKRGHTVTLLKRGRPPINGQPPSPAVVSKPPQPPQPLVVRKYQATTSDNPVNEEGEGAIISQEDPAYPSALDDGEINEQGVPF